MLPRQVLLPVSGGGGSLRLQTENKKVSRKLSNISHLLFTLAEIFLFNIASSYAREIFNANLSSKLTEQKEVRGRGE
jgi:hypothetical protein